MIIWLASYPKSGNTWLRTILGQLLFSKNKKESEVFKNLDLITSYPQKKHLRNISEKLTHSKFKDQEEVIKSWIKSQDIINLDNKIKFFKTHNFACKRYNEADKKNYSFTEEINEFCLARDFIDNSGISNVIEMMGVKNLIVY